MLNGPAVPVSVNDALRVKRILSFNFVVVRPEILNPSIRLFNSVRTVSYVALLGEVYSEIAEPATVTLYLVSTDVPDILIVPCLLALNVGSAFLATVVVLFVTIDLSCIVSIS